MKHIHGFHGQYRFLSNFWRLPYPIIDWFENIKFEYSTSEHMYQAMKSTSIEDRHYIESLPTPGAAKRGGQEIECRYNWDEIKLDVMLEILRKKYSIPELRKLLLATGDAELVEVNGHHDLFWGTNKDLKGKNMLGNLTMQVRTEIRNSF